MAAVASRANQPPPLAGYDLYAQNRPLVEAVAREGREADDDLRAFGSLLGGAPLEWGRLANENPPRLLRDDIVEFHPAWHELMRLGVTHGLHASPWRGGSHVSRAAAFTTFAQVEAGVGCPLSMTFASIPALRAESDVLDDWFAQLTSLDYDSGSLCGMAMTERQGGSDVRANELEARPLSADEATLHGEKWFCSAPMCDVFLVLAQAPHGLTCYLVPRADDAFHIERLKDKLGNRSNASAEIRLDGAHARRIGEEGRGVRTIIEMVVHTRLDCVLGSTGLIRRAVAEATHHAAHRSAFGRMLNEQPLMQNVLADLCVDAEAATLLALRLARAYDENDHAFRRLATTVAKYWVCKTAPPLVAEALECIGGNGYVEESVLPRLYRESPLNSLWEGAGNIQALDVLRALDREPESGDAVLAEIEHGGLETDSLRVDLAAADEAGARRIVERLALCLAGSLVVRHSPAAVADAFCATRLGGEGGRAYGTLPRGLDYAEIVERHRPHV